MSIPCHGLFEVPLKQAGAFLVWWCLTFWGSEAHHCFVFRSDDSKAVVVGILSHYPPLQFSKRLALPISPSPLRVASLLLFSHSQGRTSSKYPKDIPAQVASSQLLRDKGEDWDRFQSRGDGSSDSCTLRALEFRCFLLESADWPKIDARILLHVQLIYLSPLSRLELLWSLTKRFHRCNRDRCPSKSPKK